MSVRARSRKRASVCVNAVFVNVVALYLVFRALPLRVKATALHDFNETQQCPPMVHGIATNTLG